MRARSELAGLLELLHEAARPFSTLEATYRTWRHNGRALDARSREQRRNGASTAFFSSPDHHADRGEVAADLRIWLAGDRAREEHVGGQDDGAYGVRAGDLWWSWRERDGAYSNEANLKIGSAVGTKPAFMNDPTPLLGALKFAVIGHSQIAERATVTADARLRPTSRAKAAGLYELGWGADQYILEVDSMRGVLLQVRALVEGEEFETTTTTAIRFDASIPEERFRFVPPIGERVQPAGPTA